VGRNSGNYYPTKVHQNLDASTDALPDAGLAINGKWGGRSPMSKAKGRATGMLMQEFISLMGFAH